MNIYKLILLILLLSTKQAHSYTLFKAEKLDLEYSILDPDTRDPYLPEYTSRWRERAALKWTVSLLDRVYWDNNIHTETIDTGQVKTVGWEWEVGLRLLDQLEVWHHHHSRHVMEEKPEDRFPNSSDFPVEDSFGLRIKFITTK